MNNLDKKRRDTDIDFLLKKEKKINFFEKELYINNGLECVCEHEPSNCYFCGDLIRERIEY